MGRYDYWPEYVPVAKRKEQAAKKVAQLKKKGHNIMPVVIEGRKIASTFWGKAWCENLESYSDYESRMPRGRTYVRNGSVIHLEIGSGDIKAMVSGSSIYEVNVTIKPVKKEKWDRVVTSCSGSIGSMVELLQGKFSKSVMEIIVEKDKGLFPSPEEIKVKCSCPDYASMCKHVAAVMYGVGARLDGQPELLFQLRQADHFELLNSANISSNLDSDPAQNGMDTAGLSALFGIDIEDSANITNALKAKVPKSKVKAQTAKPKTVKKQVKRKVEKEKNSSPAKNKVNEEALNLTDIAAITAAIERNLKTKLASKIIKKKRL